MICLGSSSTRNNDHPHSLTQTLPVNPTNLAKPSSKAASCHRRTQSTGSDDTDAGRFFCSCPQDGKPHHAACLVASFAADLLKFNPFTQPRSGRKSERPAGRIHRLMTSASSFVAGIMHFHSFGKQPLASSLTAAVQNSPAPFGFHTCAKAVLAFTRPF